MQLLHEESFTLLQHRRKLFGGRDPVVVETGDQRTRRGNCYRQHGLDRLPDRVGPVHRSVRLAARGQVTSGWQHGTPRPVLPSGGDLRVTRERGEAEKGRTIVGGACCIGEDYVASIGWRIVWRRMRRAGGDRDRSDPDPLQVQGWGRRGRGGLQSWGRRGEEEGCMSAGLERRKKDKEETEECTGHGIFRELCALKILLKGGGDLDSTIY